MRRVFVLFLAMAAERRHLSHNGEEEKAFMYPKARALCNVTSVVS